MFKKYTLKQRIWLVIIEIVIGTTLVFMISSISSSVLLSLGKITVPNDDKITISQNVSRKQLLSELNSRQVDYIIFEKHTGKRILGRYVPNEIKLFKKAAKKQRDITVAGVEFKYFTIRHGALVIRQNSVPEFTEHRLRQFFAYNQLNYLLLILGLCLVIGGAIFKFIHELNKDFQAIKEISLTLGQKKLTKQPKNIKIIEFETILMHLYQKSAELATLLEQERLEKQDLSFQIAALAHDIKTPLTVVKGNLELLEATETSAQQTEFLKSISKSVTVFEKYFNEMVTYARLINDDVRTKIELQQFIAEVRLEFEELAKMYQVQLICEIEVTRTTFWGNAPALSRALLNLFVNACQYAKAGDKQVRVCFSETETELLFEIWNNGAPFSKEAKQKATQLFFTENKGRGAHYGIGLAFAKAVSLKYGGSLTLSDPLIGGAKVSFKIKKEA